MGFEYCHGEGLNIPPMLQVVTNRIGLSIVAIYSDGSGSAAEVQLLITLFYIPSRHNFSENQILPEEPSR